MRIVARRTPHTIARNPLTRALRQVLDVAGDGHPGAAARADKHRHRIRQSISRPIRVPFGSGAHHPHFARKMALRTNTVASFGRELRRIHDAGSTGDVRFAGPVAAFTGHAAFAKRRIAEPVLRSRHDVEETRMAPETARNDGSRQVRIRVAVVGGRKVPLARSGVPGDRRLEQEPVRDEGVTARRSARADEPGKLFLPCSPGAPSRSNSTK